MTDTLHADRADLWYVRPQTVADPGRLGVYERWLTDDERARWKRFRRDEWRHEFLVTRALVRTVLSQYTGVPPDRWRFTVNRHGRPEISEPHGIPPLRFNLSHTQGLIACLVALEREVGVDVEHTGRGGRLLAIAERYFAPAEREALRELPEAERRERFFEYWTLKESFIKAVGVGVSFGLSRFAFELDPIRIAFAEGVADDPGSWQFTLRRLGADHVVATSIRRQGGRDLELRHLEMGSDFSPDP
jgi:4'-phosphopantetheinyl transferase